MSLLSEFKEFALKKLNSLIISLFNIRLRKYWDIVVIPQAGPPLIPKKITLCPFDCIFETAFSIKSKLFLLTKGEKGFKSKLLSNI